VLNARMIAHTPRSTCTNVTPFSIVGTRMNSRLKPTTLPGQGFQGLWRPTACVGSGHFLGPLHVPLEAERCGRRAIAVPIVTVDALVTAGVCE